jgi:Flp pilus assembly protein TadG
MMAVLRPLLRSDAGGIAIISAIVLPVLIGFASLGVEAGNWYRVGRAMQGASDAAAISAAASFVAGESGYIAVGQTYATKNGYTDGINNVTVVVHPVNAKNQIVVDISQVQSQMFLPVIVHTIPVACGAIQTRQVCVKAHSVVTLKTTAAAGGNGCLIGLNKTVTALQVGGNGSLQASSCVAASDTNASGVPGLTVVGNGTLALSKLILATQTNGVGAANWTCNKGPCTIGALPVSDIFPLTTPDPFATFTNPTDGSIHQRLMPTPPTCTNPPTTTTNGITFYQPGAYCNGISVSGGRIVFNPGVYYLVGSNFAVSGGFVNQAYVTGATIASQGAGGYHNNDVVTVSGGTTVGGFAATLKLTVNGGTITAVTIVDAGFYSVTPTNSVAVTGGKGSGAKFNLTFATPFSSNPVSFLLTAPSPSAVGNVSINNNNGVISLSAISAPGSPWDGLLFWQDAKTTCAGCNGASFGGNPSSLKTLNGSLYFPSTNVDVAGNTNFLPTICTAIVAQVISFSGNGGISKGCLPIGGGGVGGGTTVFQLSE